jgi:hypothetical protein
LIVPAPIIKISCSLDDLPYEAQLRASSARLNIDPETTEKIVILLKVFTDFGLSTHDALEAVKTLGSPGAGFAGVTSAALKVASTGSDGAQLKYLAMGTNQISLSLSLAKIGSMTSPGRIGTTMVLTFAQKGLALAGVTDLTHRQKIGVAIGKLAADTVLTGPALLTPLGPLVALGLALDAYDLYSEWAKQ